MAEDKPLQDQGTRSKGKQPPLSKTYDLRLSEDRMNLFIDCSITPETKDAVITEVCAELLAMGVRDDEYIATASQRLSELVEQGPEITHYLLLQGHPPTPPKHGEIIWAQDFFAKGFEIDPVTGAADYRRKLAKLSVVEGQLLATAIPPVPGENGRDLLGRTVPPEKARRAIIRAGNNVRHQEEDDTFYATRDGRVRFVGGVLSVDDLFIVSGSVDLKTGHIKHPGALIVEQNIESEGEVETAGDVEVRGYVENARIKTEGNLSVQGGITGSHLIISGSLHAKFLQDSYVEAGGDIFVDREIDQSEIKTCGRVNVLKGRIVGGNVTALGGIETDQIGSDAYIRTTLIAGEDYTLGDRLAEKDREIQIRKETLARIVERVKPFSERIKTLTPRMRESLVKLQEEAAKIRKAIQVIEDEMEEMRADSKARARCEIVIRRLLFPDAFIHCAPLSILVKDTLEGPIKATIRDGKLVLIKMRSHS